MTFSDFDLEHFEDLLYGKGTWFHAWLARLIAKADSANLERLRLGFHEEVAAYERWLGSGNAWLRGEDRG